MCWRLPPSQKYTQDRCRFASNQALYIYIRDFLQTIYADKKIDNTYVKTLAMMITGMILGSHVQLFAIAMCVPLTIKLLSIVRRFERFVTDEQVEVEKYFEPFVRAMIISLGNETAYLLIDCTQAGRKCRTLFIGLAYHHTVLPLVWKTLKGKKGHVKGAFQKNCWNRSTPGFNIAVGWLSWAMLNLVTSRSSIA